MEDPVYVCLYMESLDHVIYYQQIQLVLSSTKTQFDVNNKFSMKLPKF